MVTTTGDTISSIWKILDDVPDPEIPVLSVKDLGIIRDVSVDGDEVIITTTPTYSGCPAIDAINIDIRLKLAEHGFKKVSVKQMLSPAWTTEWMTEEGKAKLKAYGIAAPHNRGQNSPVECPRCNSRHTNLISQFGSTACKALYQCSDCKEVFDYFKCH